MLTTFRLFAVTIGLSLLSSVSLAQTQMQLVLKKDIAFDAQNSRSSQSFYTQYKNDHCYISLVGNNLRNSQYVNAQGLIVLPAGLKFTVVSVVDNDKGLDLETQKIYTKSFIYSSNRDIDTSLKLICARKYSLFSRIEKPKEVLGLFTDVVSLQQ
ncbi:hypothetical protein [Bdellovibrio bacteriovorus]|uniref:Uncharacterized protein n=1 Tax=Bdellovibrio bacteriovorus TaxID=959 RepID=A0A1Z3NB40_BDEBC|nr:hypothetical protein [Bdellovibrio bacteriovorus]ASD64703.1 hypothetical protein B9G79_14580 [Bdellovibrio bacteriovorus]